MTELHTTFKLLREANACKPSYVKFAEAIGGVKAYGDSTPIPLSKILEVNGLDDALWCLKCVLPEETAARDKLVRLLACDCAERVLPIFERTYPQDARPRQAIETARLFAAGLATKEQVASAAAWAGEAAEAAWAAAGAAGGGGAGRPAAARRWHWRSA